MYMIIGSDGNIWAWDTVKEEMYEYDAESDTGTLRKDTTLQMLSKFVPTLKLIKKVKKKPAWFPNSEEANKKRAFGL